MASKALQGAGLPIPQVPKTLLMIRPATQLVNEAPCTANIVDKLGDWDQLLQTRRLGPTDP